jgi:hypothetical protein
MYSLCKSTSIEATTNKHAPHDTTESGRMLVEDEDEVTTTKPAAPHDAAASGRMSGDVERSPSTSWRMIVGITCVMFGLVLLSRS